MQSETKVGDYFSPGERIDLKGIYLRRGRSASFVLLAVISKIYSCMCCAILLLPGLDIR